MENIEIQADLEACYRPQTKLWGGLWGFGGRVLSREVSVKVGAMSRVYIKGWFLKWVYHEGESVKGVCHGGQCHEGGSVRCGHEVGCHEGTHSPGQQAGGTHPT